MSSIFSKKITIYSIIISVIFIFFSNLVLPSAIALSFNEYSKNNNLLKDSSPSDLLANFNPGNIVSDDLFFATGFMTQDQIENFLTIKGQECKETKGILCLKSFTQTTTTKKANQYCPIDYVGGDNQTAAQIIEGVSQSCNISEYVILVTLQKEQGLVTSINATANTYKTAMGYACPDSAKCDSTYYGFFNQVYSAAKQFSRYKVAQEFKYKPGVTININYKPDPSSCGNSPVLIQNWATAALYTYTPYQPNAASLKAGFGKGDSCSSYGNRNFFLFFSQWFGSTQDIPIAAGNINISSPFESNIRVNTTIQAIPENWTYKQVQPDGSIVDASNDISYSYQWLANNVPIKNANNNILFLGGSKYKKEISCIVTASKQGYATIQSQSKPLVVKKGIFSPKITLPKYGVKNKKITPQIKTGLSGKTILYSWLSAGKHIKKASQKSFIPKQAYKKLMLKVRIKKANFLTWVGYSAKIKVFNVKPKSVKIKKQSGSSKNEQ